MTMPPEFDPEPDFEHLPEDEDDQPFEVPDESDFLDSYPVRPDSQPVDFEELTLAELTGRLLRAPRETWRMLAQVARRPTWEDTPGEFLVTTAANPPLESQTTDADFAVTPSVGHTIPARIRSEPRTAIQLGLYMLALIVAWWGTNILTNSPVRIESLALDKGAPLLIAGFLIWLTAEIYGNWSDITGWWRQRNHTDTEMNQADSDLEQKSTVAEQTVPYPTEVWTGIHPARVFMGIGSLLFTLLAWQGNAGNHFTTGGVIAWILSITLLVGALAVPAWNPAKGIVSFWRRLRHIRIRGNWTLIALVVITLLGAWFRLYNLQGIPPEMTDDHVEKLLDSQRVLDGTTQVFFPNNGGREPLQMYLMAAFSKLPGQGMNFMSLKLLAALEGILTLPVMWWLGREIVGDRDRKLGNAAGLILAALVAVSYWHTAITRLALRIVLMPLVTALLIIYLTRAIRHVRRNDFIMAGLMLGFSLYVYQAARMLPIVVLTGVGMAFLFKGRGWSGRGRYVINLAVLIAVAFVVFVPLFGYSIDKSIYGPDHFWKRTFGRVLGDDVIQTTDAQGRIIEHNATIQERLDAFNRNLPVLMDNIRNALLMYNWKGDVAWINAVPNTPEMDTLTGALLIVGLAAWLARMFRRRDVADWLIPIALFIMLMPSAFSIAMPMENPSATRASGSLPEAYLIAAFPLALIVTSIKHIGPGRGGTIVATVLTGAIVLGAYGMNSNLYFVDYLKTYLPPSYPYTEAGRILRGFAESDGSFGNAFVIGYSYWWSHRAVGLEAGLEGEWPNGIDDPDGTGPRLPVDDIPRMLYNGSLRRDRYRFDPDKDILFFYALEDTVTDERLKEMFPSGRAQRIEAYAEQMGDDFMIYRVPFMGADDFAAFLEQYQ